MKQTAIGVVLGLVIYGSYAQAVELLTINHRVDCLVKNPSRWTLCGFFMTQQYQGSPAGGPQGLESYVQMTHVAPESIDLAIGTIGHIEQAGSGAVRRAEALRGGIVVSGPGRVQEAAALSLYQATRKGEYAGPVNVERSIYILFDNGWSIRPDGPLLLLCDPSNRCRSF